MTTEPPVDNAHLPVEPPPTSTVDSPSIDPVHTGDNFCVGAVSAPLVHVMSYNIRCARAETEPGDPDHWPDRRPLLIELLGREQPTLLGLQEVRSEQVEAVVEALPTHRALGFGRDGGSDGEHNLLLVDTERYDVAAWDQEWLSETPRLIGSRGWDADITRVLVWARLRDRATGAESVAVNTHFDHRGERAREASAEQIRALVAERFGGLPVVLTGDFNAGAGSPPYAVLTGGGWRDTWEVAVERLTPAVASFADYRDPEPDGTRIDWILVTGPVAVRSAAINATRIGDRFPSDHLPVHAVLEPGAS